jgi:hypothetical protein
MEASTPSIRTHDPAGAVETGIRRKINQKSRPACRRHRLYLFVAWLDGRRAEEFFFGCGERRVI